MPAPLLPDSPENEQPDSNTLGGTTSTGAGPDGVQTDTPAPETTGLGNDDLADAGEVARRINERNPGHDQAQPS